MDNVRLYHGGACSLLKHHTARIAGSTATVCRLVNAGREIPPEDDPLSKQKLFRGAHGTLVVGILPVALFASGHTFFVSRLHEQLSLQPYVVHATFMFSGTPGKRNRFREFMLWRDPPEYYAPDFPLVTWDMDVPEALRTGAPPPGDGSLECCDAQQGHFRLVNHQLQQLRHGLAAATVRLQTHPRFGVLLLTCSTV